MAAAVSCALVECPFAHWLLVSLCPCSRLWLAGLPVGALLCFKAHMDVRGLWSGLALGTTVQGAIMLLVLSQFDWHKEARKAAARVAADGDAVAENSSGEGSGGGGIDAAAEAELTLAENGAEGRDSSRSGVLLRQDSALLLASGAPPDAAIL